jgi:hypothetical protein
VNYRRRNAEFVCRLADATTEEVLAKLATLLSLTA